MQYASLRETGITLKWCLFFMLKASLNISEVPPSIAKEELLQNLRAAKILYSVEPEDRVFRAHGKPKSNPILHFKCLFLILS